ncbi:hypothetical protein BJ322DRAFT_824180 [Thelephora terrestris]|uniref:Uncharacterized protein n=1 Tax=Thelephora terrestris TaxID=56493 RepID=A0A9P6HH88_9AGAM|nr:hypothetical protein BJ322DRAFT_824180 [Thelephora terrestris]
MASKRPHWDLYNHELSEFNSGHALDPSPVADSERIEPGDVGYIRTGCFHLLFSAGLPLGERRLGSDVPRTFKRLDVGKIVKGAPLAAGALCTKDVRETRVHSTPSEVSSTPASSPPPSPQMGSTSVTSFRLTGGQGAALLTKYSTYREDIQRTGTFEKYAKEHYDSWVTFARETGHGDVNPVLITGVDRTRDFAMMCYSNGDDDLECQFTTSAPGATDWGTWQKTGLVYTNHGPQLRCPPSSVQATELASSNDGNARTVADEYNQCVFIRYYTVRKRLGIPRIIKAAAGPHELGRGGYDGDGPSLEAHYDSEQDSDSDSESDTASSIFDNDSDDDGCSILSDDTESDVVMHNTTVDGRDDFDVIADYIFHNSDANSVLLHHQDVALLRELGGSADLPAQLFERRPQITVDENGGLFPL